MVAILENIPLNKFSTRTSGDGARDTQQGVSSNVSRALKETTQNNLLF